MASAKKLSDALTRFLRLFKSNDVCDLTLFSLFPQFYPIHFRYTVNWAERTECETFSDLVVKLSCKEDKIIFMYVKLASTEFVLDEENHAIKAEHTGVLTEQEAEQWMQAVAKRISKCDLDVFYGAAVHVGLKAEAVRDQINMTYPDVSCELNRKQLTLLLYLNISHSPDILKKAKGMAEIARPPNFSFSEFTTLSGIRVCLCHDDITKVPSDCVVSAADKKLTLDSGEFRDIRKAVGPKMREDCKEHLETHGTLKVTDVVATSGQPLWKTILHAYGPEWRADDGPKCQRDLKQTIYNCLKKAEILKHSSIALPMYWSRKFKIPPEICAQSYMAAMEKFDKLSHTSLKKILFVDSSFDQFKHIHDILCETMQPVSTLRLVLVGKIGVGKSSTGNSILRRAAFKSGQRLKAITTESRLEKVNRNGVCIEIVDSPGFLEDDDPQHTEENLKEVVKTVTLTLPGPHAFLLFFKGNDRFSKSEIDVCNLFRTLFSNGDDDTNLMQFIIVVFTHVESSEQRDTLFADPPEHVKTLLKVSCGRVVCINNSTTFGRSQPDIDTLVKTALDLRERNLGEVFSNILVSRCLQLLQSDEYREKSLEDIKQEIMRGKMKMVTKLTSDKKALQYARNFKECTIL